MRLAFVLTLLVGWAFVQGVVAQDVTTETTQQLEQAIEESNQILQQRQQELAEIEAVLGESAVALEERVNERDRVSAELAERQAERSALLVDIEAANEAIATTAARITTLQDDLANLKVRVQELLVTLYKQRTGRFANLLSEAESFHDLRKQNYFLSLLSEQDVSLINDLDATVNELAALQAEQQAQLNELSSKEAELRETEAALSASQAELDAIIAELNATREGQLALQQNLLEQQVALEQQLEDLFSDLNVERYRERARQAREARARAAIAERNRARAEAAEAAPDAAPTEPEPDLEPVAEPENDELPPLASGYTYPVESPRLVSRFGENRAQSVKLQALEAGAAVRAVQPGLVIAAELVSANQGYYVAIQHDEGLITAYVNLQANLSVEVGDTVTQQQIIGYLGGATLIRPDELEFYTGRYEGGTPIWTDPAALLGF